MAWVRVIIEDENGTQLGDAVDIATSAFPQSDDARYVCLRFIDPYGDTVFNRLQVPILIDELHALGTDATTSDDRMAIQKIELLAKNCKEQAHLYLRFIGD